MLLWQWGSGAPGHRSLCCNKHPQSVIHYQWIPWGAFSPSLKREGFAIDLFWTTNFWSGLESIYQHHRNQNLTSRLVHDRPDRKLMLENIHSRPSYWFWVKGLVVCYLWNLDYSFLPLLFYYSWKFFCASNWKVLAKLILSDVQKTWSQCM